MEKIYRNTLKIYVNNDFEGTGFYFNIKGWVITCWHLFKRHKNAKSKISINGEIYTVFTKDEKLDYAILKPLHNVNKKPLPLDYYFKLSDGETIFEAYGYGEMPNKDNPKKLKGTLEDIDEENNLCRAVISNLSRGIIPGDSGSPVFVDGKIVGILKAKQDIDYKANKVSYGYVRFLNDVLFFADSTPNIFDIQPLENAPKKIIDKLICNIENKNLIPQNQYQLQKIINEKPKETCEAFSSIICSKVERINALKKLKGIVPENTGIESYYFYVNIWTTTEISSQLDIDRANDIDYKKYLLNIIDLLANDKVKTAEKFARLNPADVIEDSKAREFFDVFLPYLYYSDTFEKKIGKENVNIRDKYRKTFDKNNMGFALDNITKDFIKTSYANFKLIYSIKYFMNEDFYKKCMEKITTNFIKTIHYEQKCNK